MFITPQALPVMLVLFFSPYHWGNTELKMVKSFVSNIAYKSIEELSFWILE